MSGALSRLPVRSSRRRRFDQGGLAYDPAASDYAATMSGGIGPIAPGVDVMDPGGAGALSLPAPPRPAPTGALAAGAGAGPQQPPNGPLSMGSDQDRARAAKAAHMARAQQILAAGGQQVSAPFLAAASADGQQPGFDQSQAPPRRGFQDFSGPGWTNLPQLAAASALLAPTRTGSFAESLSNAFGAAGGAAEKQRELLENAALRAQQQEDMNLYRMGMVGARQQHEDAYTASQNARVPLMEAQAAAAMARATGALANGANKITPAELDQTAALELVNTKGPDGSPALGPDGKPWSFATALQFVRSSQSSLMNAQTRQDGMVIAAGRLKVLQDQLAETKDENQRKAIRAAIEEQTKILLGTKDLSGKPTMTPEDAGKVVGTMGGAPPPPSAPKTTPAGVPLGSQYSPSRKAWRTPDGKIIPDPGTADVSTASPGAT
jgi:hypothetical protein